MTIESPKGETEPGFTLRVSVRGGVGNRVLGLLSALVVSEELNVNLEIIWEPDAHCPAPFEALFQPVGINISSEKVDDESWRRRSFPTRELFKNAGESTRLVEIRPNPIFGEDLFPPNVFAEKLRARISRLEPAPGVSEILKGMPKSTIGIHVRMTDHLPCQLITPSWCYALAVREATAAGITPPILVCSDTPEFFEVLQKRFGSRVIRLTSPFTSSRTSRASVESIKYALADLLLLARCDVILASKESSFARLAHMIGTNELFPLNGLPHVFRSKQSQAAWWIAGLCELDAKKNKWIATKRTSFVSGWFGVLCAKLVTSRIYQKRPLPTLRSRNREYLRQLFKHPRFHTATGGTVPKGQTAVARTI